MDVARYLPSGRLASMASALLLAGGLIFAAQYIRHPSQTNSSLASTQQSDAQDTDWQDALAQVAATSGVAPPATVDPSQVSQLVSEASTPNLTDSVGKSLFINLAAAEAQGLGDDEPTQDQIVSQVAAQAATSTPITYQASDLTIIPDSNEALHTFGNAVMTAAALYPDANTNTVYVAVGYATDYQDSSRLAPLETACPAFGAFAQDLLAVPVPQTLAPLYLEAINDLAAIGDSCGDLEHVLDDPVRGLDGLQQFEVSGQNALNVFTSIAEELNTDGILFSKDEPGSAWSAFTSASAQ